MAYPMKPTRNTRADAAAWVLSQLRQRWMRTLMLAALVAPLCLAGCGSNPPTIDTLPSDASIEMLGEAVEKVQASMGTQQTKYASQQLYAAEFAQHQAEISAKAGDAERAKELLREAAHWFEQARVVAENVASDRILRFPEDRSMGEVFVRDWDVDREFRPAGEAKGSIRVDAGNMVHLKVSRDFSDADLDNLLATNRPGAVQYLSLADSDVTSIGVAKLPQMEGLIDLSLYGRQLDPEAWKAVGELKALRHLNLILTNIDTPTLQSLGTYPAMEDLSVDQGGGLDAEALLTLRTYPRIQSLVLRGLELDDTALDYLAKTESLERLWVGGKGITKHGVELLRDLPHLRELVLLSCSATDEEVDALSVVLPKCTIDSLDG